ncbi:CbiX protein [Orenia metallireducens]|uniref:CbiX protein n=1 Tax=Orenia metallireducens TaxID=1413210 RepID=A0A285GPP2_9FIRM|nr:CbiX/SirB N-terminal domain-containing protein [Orenia metallireducens]PRX29841.1 CbiX protein [Orenia metallireducens]SNY25263.1 CbiX protein [Orenia metallireducens]
MKTGVIILGHGSRTVEANQVFDSIVEMVKEEIDYEIVEKASMELAKPSLAQSIEKVVKAGVKKVIVVPLFLFPGIHIQEDIPKLIKLEQKKYPEVEFIFGRNIGADQKIAELMVERVKEVG